MAGAFLFSPPYSFLRLILNSFHVYTARNKLTDLNYSNQPSAGTGGCIH
jgi:hypothetical protein